MKKEDTLLDLFSGSGSVKKVCKSLNIKCTSLDISNKYSNPDILVDIMKWDYKNSGYKPGDFKIIFAGIPCTEYSHIQNINRVLYGKEPDIKSANKISRKTLEIIDYFKPDYYFIENPETSTLKNQSFMKKLPYYTVSYCKYGFLYRKNTRIFTNLEGFEPKYCKNDCRKAKMNGGRHPHIIGDRTNDISINISSLKQKYSYPPKLIKDLLKLAIEK